MVGVQRKFQKNSKFWSKSQNILIENNPNYKEIFVEEEFLGRELNSNLEIKLKSKLIDNSFS